MFQDLEGEENALSTMNMQMESFYQGAKDADILIYNSAIDANLTAIEELVAKSEPLADFKAVRNGDVYREEHVPGGPGGGGYDSGHQRRPHPGGPGGRGHELPAPADMTGERP